MNYLIILFYLIVEMAQMYVCMAHHIGSAEHMAVMVAGLQVLCNIGKGA